MLFTRQGLAVLRRPWPLCRPQHESRRLGFSQEPNLSAGLHCKVSEIAALRCAALQRVRVGLVDSLSDGRALGSSESRSILFGSQLKIQTLNPKPHLISPLNSPKFEIETETTGSSSFPRVFSSELNDIQLSLSGSLPIPIGNRLIGSLFASEIEPSDDYTCIISHGPNPKTTHIFDDCILDSETIRSLDCKNTKNVDASLPSDDFLSYCFPCNK